MDAITRAHDIYFNKEEYMESREEDAKKQGLKVRYDLNKGKVWLYNEDGEGGSFDLFDFLLEANPSKFFAENF